MLRRTTGQGCLPGLRATSVKTWFRRTGVRVEVVRHGGGVLGRRSHQQVLPVCGWPGELRQAVSGVPLVAAWLS